MVNAAPIKCAICAESETNLHKISENVLGKELLGVISRICPTEQAAQERVNKKACICTECAIEVLHVDHLVSKIRQGFIKKTKKAINGASNGNTSKVTTKTNNTTKVNTADDFIFNCKTCGFETLKLKAYRQHMLKSHGESILKPYLCQLCGDSFARYDYYVKHQSLIHGVKKIIIKTELPEYNEYDNVVDEQYDELKNESNVKNNDNNDENENEDEDDEDNGEMFKCLECNYEIDRPKIFYKHMTKTHKADKNNIFRCTKCSKSYGRVSFYRQHLEVHKDGYNAPLPQLNCNICNRKFFKITGLIMHMKSHAALKGQGSLTVLNEETMLSGATATSTPVNIKKIDTPKADSVSPKKKHLMNEQSFSKKDTTLSKKSKVSASFNKSIQKNSTSISNADVNDSMKRKHNEEAGMLPNGKSPNKKKKQHNESTVKIEKDEHEEEEEQNTQTENEYVCGYCKKSLSSSKKLSRHISKKHTII